MGAGTAGLTDPFFWVVIGTTGLLTELYLLIQGSIKPPALDIVKA